MKYSIFNTKLSIKDKHTLFFNALSGKTVVVKNRLFEQDDLNPIKLERESPTLFKQMMETGVFVDSNLDEFKVLQERVNQDDNNRSNFILHVNPTLDCNFHCWYCYENHIKGSKMGQTVLSSVKNFITRTLDKNNEIKLFDLGFFGGEPLMHFEVIARPIIEHLCNECEKRKVDYRVSFTTNAGLLTDEMADFLIKHNTGFQITLDGGREHHNETRFNKGGIGSYDTIIQNIHRLINRKMEVITRVNYTSRNISSVMDILESFVDIPNDLKPLLRFDFQRVWQDRKDGYADADSDDVESSISIVRDKFVASGFNVLLNYIPHTGVSSCYGDKLNHILVNYNGDIFGCTARDFTHSNRLGYLDENGCLQFDDEEFIKLRNSSKLSKVICRSCRIAPICCGGCKQKATEDLHNVNCTFGYTAEDMDNIVIDIIGNCL